MFYGYFCGDDSGVIFSQKVEYGFDRQNPHGVFSNAVGCFFINSLFSFPLRMSIPPLYLMMLLTVKKRSCCIFDPWKWFRIPIGGRYADFIRFCDCS
jgi:hypothetical protein